jgi:hypothetical protein
MVLFQNCVRQSRSPTQMAATVQLRCYWKQFWSRWAITVSCEPLVLSYCWWQKSDIWSQASYTNVGIPYRGKSFWTHQIPTSCLLILLILMHIEYICSCFAAVFSDTIDRRDLISGHKLHIGTPHRGNRFWTHHIITSCLPTLLIWIHIEHTFVYAYFSSHLSKQLLMTGIWYLVTSFIYVCHIVEAFLDPSDSYFLFAALVGFYKHLTYMHIFRGIFLSKYWWQRSDIWSQALYRYHISWEVFFDPSDSYFLFAEERGYHKWALAHS